jgi:hypothetical protein
MADNVSITAGSGVTISSEEVTTLNGGAVSAQQVQRVAIASRTGDGTAVDLQGSTADGLLVNLGANNDVTVTSLPAIPAGTNNIGDVDVVTVNGVAPAFGSGVRGATVQRVTVATDDLVPVSMATNTPVGTVAHDSADSGNPVKVGAKASATLSDDTMVANGDRTDLTSDLDGAVLFRSQFPLGDLLAERVTDTSGTSTAFSTFGATASTRSYVTAISVYNTSATAGYIDFRDGTGGSVLWTVPIPAGGGAVISSPHPLFRTSTNTALAYDVSGALTTVYISISGFKSKV